MFVTPKIKCVASIHIPLAIISHMTSQPQIWGDGEMQSSVKSARIDVATSET